MRKIALYLGAVFIITGFISLAIDEDLWAIAGFTMGSIWTVGSAVIDAIEQEGIRIRQHRDNYETKKIL